ncbi:hypothetical protein AgCh_038594 [Apium graveolens]
MVNGSLKTVLQKEYKNLDMGKRLLIAKDIAYGMEYLDGKNIVHFGLKSDNLLVNLLNPQRPVCKVGDLGLSKFKRQTMVSGRMRGTLPWMAPELLHGSIDEVSEKAPICASMDEQLLNAMCEGDPVDEMLFVMRGKDLTMTTNDNVIIEEVALVDGLKHNLLSTNQLCDKGNSVTFNSEACVVTNTKSNKVVLTGVRKGNVYLADFNSSNAESITCLLSKASQDESWLWHKKLSHLNFKIMNELVKKDLVRSIPQVEFTKDGLCDACQKGKQIKASFRKKLDSTIEEPLQLLHMDLFGPVNVLSISRKRFCLVIVDDFSKFSWTYFLKSKNEASEIIINHIRQVNNHLDFKVRRIRSDNETEFKNSMMRSFYEESGIMHVFSAARTPQKNGVVERKNRSLIEAARTMVEESKLPTYFWAEAMNTACYTQNISLVNQAKCMTPYQLFKNRKPTLNFLHVFGCKCCILRNQTDQYGKFDAKADEGIFVGYAVGKAYRIEGLQDGDFYESLKFDNVEIVSDDSDDESDQETLAKDNAEKSTTNEAHNSTSIELQNASSVSRQSASSAGRQSVSSVRIQSASYVEIMREAKSQNRSSTENNNDASSSRAILPQQRKWTRDHPFELIIGDASSRVQTRKETQEECLYSSFLSKEEPKRVEEALLDPDWVLSMQDELNQFERNKV